MLFHSLCTIEHNALRLILIACAAAPLQIRESQRQDSQARCGPFQKMTTTKGLST